MHGVSCFDGYCRGLSRSLLDRGDCLGLTWNREKAKKVSYASESSFNFKLIKEAFTAWRSPTDFTKLHPTPPSPVRSLILTLFTQLVAHSTSSGLSPPTLSSVFRPLIFSLLSLAFHQVYAAYLRAAHATEHLMLSFIRLPDAQAPVSVPIPIRLKSWIKRYPGMRPRRGVRTTRVTSVRRDVCLYSINLARTCALLGREREGANSGDLRSSKELQRIAPAGASNLPPPPPRYSDAYRSKMYLLNSFNRRWSPRQT
ncbi:hypothetical protein BD410DRAFT_844462 [Rickenella mellea]|uniref:Uncharacterized protein n=1 Tax=Rickenella mellea TaxID=50990 RepID=A0A4Y7PPL4_9AGAM|nr:hypothetical protein BD410DRAFT_844462 [Rickenella mellea]